MANDSSDLLTVTTLVGATEVVVLVAGELDMSSGPQLELAAVTAGAYGLPVVFDMGQVDFVDSGGLAAMLAVRKRLGCETVQLRHPSTAVRRLVDLSGLGSVFASTE